MITDAKSSIYNYNIKLRSTRYKQTATPMGDIPVCCEAQLL